MLFGGITLPVKSYSVPATKPGVVYHPEKVNSSDTPLGLLGV